MPKDPYRGFAARYDWMKTRNPERERFFRNLFRDRGVQRVLDCACGTGVDLLLFHALGCSVRGSDLSPAMLAQARRRLAGAHVDVPLVRLDYRELTRRFGPEFDAVACLSNAINEPLRDTDTLRALRSMRSVLRDGGVLVFDQGQTDALLRERPRFAPVVNDRDHSRLFVLGFTRRVMRVDVLDFTHTASASAFAHSTFRIRIRLRADWNRLLAKAGFGRVRYYGDWGGSPYDPRSSPRLIAVASK